MPKLNEAPTSPAMNKPALQTKTPKYMTDTTGKVRRRNSTLVSNDNFGEELQDNLSKTSHKNDAELEKVEFTRKNMNMYHIEKDEKKERIRPR